MSTRVWGGRIACLNLRELWYEMRIREREREREREWWWWFCGVLFHVMKREKVKGIESGF